MQISRPALVWVLTMVAATVVANTAASAVPAAQDTAAVSTDPTGAHVKLGRAGSWDEVRPLHGTGPTTGCVRHWIPSGEYELRKTLAGDYRHVPLTEPQPSIEYSPYSVWCDDQYLGTVWIRPQQFGVDPRAIAEELVLDLPYPAATVGAVPQVRGLTGLETWFWVDGYTSAPIQDTVTEFGLTVDVEATPTSVSWDFGDGTTAKGLGTAPPAPPNVVHTFENRARPAFAVRALIILSVRWRLNGGGWQDIDPVVRTAVRSYPVVESRAALVPASA